MEEIFTKKEIFLLLRDKFIVGTLPSPPCLNKGSGKGRLDLPKIESLGGGGSKFF